MASFIVFMAVIARYLSLDELGLFPVITAISLFLQTTTEFGLSVIMIREIAKDKPNGVSIFGRTMAVHLVIVLIFLVLSFVVLAIIRPEPTIAAAFTISFATTVVVLSTCNFFICVFQSYEKMKYELVCSICYNIIIIVGILQVWFFDLGFLMVFVVLLAAAMVKMGIAYYIIQKKFFRVCLLWDIGLAKNLVRESYTVAIAMIFKQATLRLDTILLKIMTGHALIALFAIPYRMVIRLKVLPTSIGRALFPEFSRSVNGTQEYRDKLYGSVFKFFLIVSLPLSLIITVLSDKIISVFLGAKFVESYIVLQMLCWILVPIFMDMVCNSILLVHNRQRILARNAIVWFLTNLVLDLALIPSYGITGAVLATVSSSFLLLILQLYEVSKYMNMSVLLKTLLKPCLIFWLCAFLVYASKDINITIGLIVALVLYIVLLFAMNIFTEEEKEILKNLRMTVLKKRKNNTVHRR